MIDTPVHGPRIAVRRMIEGPEVHDPSEDWSGKSSTIERRKLQNRLAQRKRRAQAKALKTSNTSTITQESLTSHAPVSTLASNAHTELISPLPPQNTLLTLLIHPHPQTIQNHTPLPTDQHFLSLLHFNLTRALLLNLSLLGLTPSSIQPRTPSPFHTRPYNTTLLPPSLRPTNTQLTIPHHPELDLLPFPAIRDRFILAQYQETSTINPIELCQDLLSGTSKPNMNTTRPVPLVQMSCHDDGGKERGFLLGEKTGLSVWGDPWLPGSWEMDEGFARKYWGMLDAEAVECTNFWREGRGEGRLVWEVEG